ncbi:GNAT family N-acetyltransferase [Kitasatospora sp. NPDC048540]|uniref:GNAT family N-acetyltransferase n=1 Tax=Kitasatospora sp. NPDC048540 TaxID=3155634 RepID=UPI0033E9B34E
MQGQPAHPAARPRRTGRPGRDPVRLRDHRQPGGGGVTPTGPPTGPPPIGPPTGPPSDPLDGVAHWGPMPTAAGEFRLRPVRPATDLALLTRWMNDPAVDAYWELAGPPATTARHLRAQLDGDGRSVPCLGLLDGVPIGYWEVYRADLDPLALHYPARPHDTGVHLLLGPAEARGRGLGSLLLAALADRILARRPACEQVVAEPDLRNTPSVRAFHRAGFDQAAELRLPGKRAALMVRRRAG